MTTSKWCNLGDIFDVFVGSTPSRKEESYWNGSTNWVSSSEVAFCRIKTTREKITQEGLSNSSTKLHPPGTVMLAMIGQGKTRGQPAILDITACHNQNTAAIRITENIAIPEFLYYYLYERYEDNRLRGSGNNQKAMNKQIVKSIPFPLAPIKEQEKIVKKIEQLFLNASLVEEKVQLSLNCINNLTQSILAKAFRGELTAEWRAANPDLISGENSAEVLLEKIKAERAVVKRKRSF